MDENKNFPNGQPENGNAEPAGTGPVPPQDPFSAGGPVTPPSGSGYDAPGGSAGGYPPPPAGTNPGYAPPVNSAPYQQPYGGMPPVMPVKQPGDGMAVASLVLGIISVACCYHIFIPGILSLIFGIVARSKGTGKGGMAIVGIVLGAISILIGIGMWVFIQSRGGYTELYESLLNNLQY